MKNNHHFIQLVISKTQVIMYHVVPQLQTNYQPMAAACSDTEHGQPQDSENIVKSRNQASDYMTLKYHNYGPAAACSDTEHGRPQDSENIIKVKQPSKIIVN